MPNYEAPAIEDGWWKTYSNVVTLTAYMAEHDWDATEVARAVEKPWSYMDEFMAALAEQAAEE